MGITHVLELIPGSDDRGAGGREFNSCDGINAVEAIISDSVVGAS